jgi:predicted MFS family arabinose efflux permease
MATRLGEHVRLYPRSFWALVGGSAASSLGGGALVPYWALYLTSSRHLSGAHAGALLALAGAMGVIGAPLGGALADRAGRRRTLILGLSAGVVWFVAYGFVTDATWLVVLSLFGITSDLWWAGLNAAVADVLPPERRSAGYGLVRQADMAALALGAPVGSLLVLVLSLRWIFWLHAITDAAFLVLVVLAVPETRPERDEGTEPPRLRHALRDRRLLLLTLGTTIALLVYTQFDSVLGVYLHRDRGYALATWGVVFGISPVLIGLTQYPIARWAGRQRTRTMLAAGVLLEGLALFMLWPTSVLPVLILSVVVVTAGEMLVQRAAAAATADLAPPHLRGAYDAVGAFGAALAWPAGVLSGLALVGAGHGALMLALALPVSAAAALAFSRV